MMKQDALRAAGMEHEIGKLFDSASNEPAGREQYLPSLIGSR